MNHEKVPTAHKSPPGDLSAVTLPAAGWGAKRHVLRRPPALDPTLTGSMPPASRQIYAAPHVAAGVASRDDRGGDRDDRGGDGIDWKASITFRERLRSLGLGIAEAMDTAQRGMGLGWEAAMQLIRLTVDAAQGCRLVGPDGAKSFLLAVRRLGAEMLTLSPVEHVHPAAELRDGVDVPDATRRPV